MEQQEIVVLLIPQNTPKIKANIVFLLQHVERARGSEPRAFAHFSFQRQETPKRIFAAGRDRHPLLCILYTLREGRRLGRGSSPKMAAVTPRALTVFQDGVLTMGQVESRAVHAAREERSRNGNGPAR